MLEKKEDDYKMIQLKPKQENEIRICQYCNKQYSECYCLNQ